jgi:predicted N-formylglutamate amidohydrolase
VARSGADRQRVPVVVENGDAAGACVLVCDHASNFFPPEFGFLGLSTAEREAHIAWDPGALGVSRRLAKLLDAPLVHAAVSRLIIDCNRDPDAPDLIPAISETTRIPGNAAITEAERRSRIAAFHAPFHAAIDDVINRRLARGQPTALIGVHSFTRVYKGTERPWEVGVLFDRNRRLADILIEGLKREDLNVGVNEPYSPADRVYYTLSRHAEGRGLDCVMIEIRNDLVRKPSDRQAWAERLGKLLGRLTLASRAA